MWTRACRAGRSPVRRRFAGRTVGPVIQHIVYLSFFFFQAEDGIRDTSVTGVQTCALPILDPPLTLLWKEKIGDYEFGIFENRFYGFYFHNIVVPTQDYANRLEWYMQHTRSEERRVGKECRSRRSPQQLKKNCTSTATREPV